MNPHQAVAILAEARFCSPDEVQAATVLFNFARKQQSRRRRALDAVDRKLEAKDERIAVLEARLAELESTLAAIVEYNERGYGPEYIRAIEDARLLLEPPR